MAAESPAEPPEAQPISFIGPAVNAVDDEGVGCGIQFGFSYAVSQTDGKRSGTVQSTSTDGVLVTTFQGAHDGRTGKGAIQRFSRKIERTDIACTVTLTPSGPVEEYKIGKLLNLWESPRFSPSDVLKQSFKFEYRVDLLSTQDVEHTLANFDRLADRGCSRLSYPRELGFDYRNDRGDLVYCIKVGEKSQPVKVSCTLHRKGTLCSTFAILQAVPTGNAISAIEGERRLKAAVESITAD
jgi:hypothetical protein